MADPWGTLAPGNDLARALAERRPGSEAWQQNALAQALAAGKIGPPTVRPGSMDAISMGALQMAGQLSPLASYEDLAKAWPQIAGARTWGELLPPLATSALAVAGMVPGVGPEVRAGGAIAKAAKPKWMTVFRGGGTPSSRDMLSPAWWDEAATELYSHADRVGASQYGNVGSFRVNTAEYLDARTPEGAALWKKANDMGSDGYKWLRDQGYKGAIYPDPHDWGQTVVKGPEIVTFDPQTVKLPFD